MSTTSESADNRDPPGSLSIPCAKRSRTTRERDAPLCSAASLALSDDEPLVDEHFPAPSRTPLFHDADPVLWLADRVDQRRPAVLRDLLGRSDDLCGLRAWLARDPDVAATLAEVAPSVPVTSFVSHAENFYLDGTVHPRAVLTTSMSMETTLSEHVTAAQWGNRYAVEAIDARLAATMKLQDRSPCHAALGCGNDTCGNDGCCVAKRQIFLTVGRSKTQLHRDTFANLYLCLSGWRIWELAHPVVSPQLQRSPDSVSAADRLPSSVKLSRVTLRSGDAIFVPRGWWHRVEAVGDMLPSRCSVAVNWYYNSGRAGDSSDAWPTT
jgi:hypothetical protein